MKLRYFKRSEEISVSWIDPVAKGYRDYPASVTKLDNEHHIHKRSEMKFVSRIIPQVKLIGIFREAGA